MRPALIILIALICAGCAHKPIDNPYQTFTSDMSYADVRKVVVDSGSSALQGFDQSTEKAKEGGEKNPDDLQYLVTGLNTTSYNPFTYLVFIRGKLKFVNFEYAFLPHEASPGRSENACDALFKRVVIAQITAAYGPATNSTSEPKGRNRSETVSWTSDKIDAKALMYIDGEYHPEVAEPRCGSLNAIVKFGSASERKKVDDAIERAAKGSGSVKP